MQTIKLIDTTDYYGDSCLDDFEFERDREDTVTFLNDFVKRYEKRYRTSVCAILMIAVREQPVYGNWNGLAGCTGYRLIDSPEELFDTRSDDINIYVGEDRCIHADYFDHDGANYATLKLIPQSAEDDLYAALAEEYGGVEMVGELCEEDYLGYFRKKGNLKPTKFWQSK